VSFLDATSSVQTQLNLKQGIITDGSLTIARTSGLQTALNGKQATLANASFLDATSSVQTQLNARSLKTYTDTQLATKQDTLLNALFLDATSSVQTQLDTKQATITDGSLTIARTTGLQTTLNSKANLAGPTFTEPLME
jgi:hypothetical protein